MQVLANGAAMAPRKTKAFTLGLELGILGHPFTGIQAESTTLRRRRARVLVLAFPEGSAGNDR